MNKQTLLIIGALVVGFYLFMRPSSASAATAGGSGSPAGAGYSPNTAGTANDTGTATPAGSTGTAGSMTGGAPAPSSPDFNGPASTFYNNLGYPGPFNGGEVQDGIIKEFVRIRDSAASAKNKYDWTTNLQTLAARFREQSGIQLIIEGVLQHYRDSIHDAAYPGWLARNVSTAAAGVAYGVGSLIGAPVVRARLS